MGRRTDLSGSQSVRHCSRQGRRMIHPSLHDREVVQPAGASLCVADAQRLQCGDLINDGVGHSQLRTGRCRRKLPASVVSLQP
jgi:hypothetical protein